MKIMIDRFEVEVKSARNTFMHKKATKGDLKDFLTALIVDYIDARDYAHEHGYDGIGGVYEENIKALREIIDNWEV